MVNRYLTDFYVYEFSLHLILDKDLSKANKI